MKVDVTKLKVSTYIKQVCMQKKNESSLGVIFRSNMKITKFVYVPGIHVNTLETLIKFL